MKVKTTFRTKKIKQANELKIDSAIKQTININYTFNQHSNTIKTVSFVPPSCEHLVP